MHVRNLTIFVVMAAIYGFVLEFAYGNLFEAKYRFELKEWQTLAGVLVAVAAATLAYMGVQGTQRINVMIKEQDRLDTSLPGLRQVNEPAYRYSRSAASVEKQELVSGLHLVKFRHPRRRDEVDRAGGPPSTSLSR